MNLHEYQAKELLRQFDLPLLKGKAYVNDLKTIEKISTNSRALRG